MKIISPAFLIPNNVKNNSSKINFQKKFSFFQNNAIAHDSFIKSHANVVQTVSDVQLQRQQNRNYIEQIFDEVFNETIGDVEFLDSLNIAKPKIVFCPKSNLSTELASYNFMFNEIKISDELCNQDLFSIKTTNTDGELINCQVASETFAKQYKSKNPLYTVKLTKLNEKEKELYIKSILAHELRHCIQSHIVAACNTTKEEYRAICDKLYDPNAEKLLELLSKKIELLKIMQNSGLKIDNTGDYIDESIEYYKSLMEKFAKKPYYKTYQTKNASDENMPLGLVTFISGKKYFIFGDNFLQGLKNKFSNKTGNSNIEEYLGNPEEIDAFSFELQYLINKAKSTSELRESILKEFYTAIGFNLLVGYEHYKNSGNNFLAL